MEPGAPYPAAADDERERKEANTEETMEEKAPEKER